MPDRIDEATRRKMKILENADDIFISNVRDIQEAVQKKTLRLLKSFNSKGGRISNDKSNYQILLKLNRELKQIISTSTFASDTKKYLRNFDLVEKNSRIILNSIDGVDMNKLNFKQDKLVAMETITDGLLNEQMIRVNLQQPIRRIMYRHITTGISLSDAEDELITFISGDGRAGFAERYVRTLALSSLNRYDGIINQKTAVEFDLDGFRIVGSLIKTSELSCVEMIRDKGTLGQYRVNGKFRIKDIPKIIDVIRRRPGFISGTNENNYFINGNHWGCRHSFIPTRLLERDKKAFAEKN